MANPFVHVELMSTDVNRSKEFYGKLFDWKMQDMPNPATGTYTLINVGEGTGGGMVKNPMPGRRRAGWLMCWSTMSKRRLAKPNRSARTS